jgi:peptidyl-prolyl cis-trans isomerase B (cyclophilin B)
VRRALIVAGLSLVVAGCGGSSSGGAAQVVPNSPTPTVSTGTESGGATNANGCTPVSSPKPNRQTFSAEPKVTIDRTDYMATIVTNCGTIVVTLDGKDAPHTVNSFAFLAGKHFFDNTICHRLTTSGIYVLQCGDPTGTGSGGPGYTIPDENLAGATYPAGTVAMANTGQPHTGGSQFFFVYRNTDLPPQYTPFGTITKGLDVLRRIAAAGTDGNSGSGDGAPVQPVVIESFTVTKG